MAHLTEISVLFGTTGNQLRCSRSKEPMEGGGGGYLRHVVFKNQDTIIGKNVLYKLKNHFKHNWCTLAMDLE